MTAAFELGRHVTPHLTPRIPHIYRAGHMFVQFKLVAGEEEAKAKHIVSLLAVQKHGPGLTSLLENLRRNRHPSLGRRASAVVAAASPLKMSRVGL